ncbi:MAG: hypothetical protein FJ125_08625 [Deltaproteobacteria bacterium]|nr:hypothetical protein [Deltaproteobacteria bacterium]
MFDIRQEFWDGEEFDEHAADEYIEQLEQIFARSPEGQGEGVDPSWAGILVRYGFDYHTCSPATMDASDLEELVFSIIPRKVSCSPDSAGEVVCSLRAFLAFLAREFGLSNAMKCQKALGAGAERRLRQRLEDPATWGMAKSFFMQGQRMGFDVESEEGLAKWMAFANANQLGAAIPPLAGLRPAKLPDDPGGWEDRPLPARRSPEEQRKLRNKRKQQKASRRKNR